MLQILSTDICTKELVPLAPFLAPLFDKMTNRVISQRFSAEEALQFLEWAVSGISDADLHTAIAITNDSWDMGFAGTYWNLLSPQFHATWGPYISPPPSSGDKLAGYIQTSDIGWSALRFTRQILGI